MGYIKVVELTTVVLYYSCRDTGEEVFKMSLDVKPSYCKGCGICVTFCPKQVLALDEKGKIFVKDPEKCTDCGQCELRCPDFAIKLVKTGRGESNG